MTCTTMFAFKLQANSNHMPISKMPKHEILNRCGSQTSLKDDDFFFSPFFLWFWPPWAHITQKSQIYRLILHIKSEKYRSDLALTLSLYLYSGLLLILHIKYWSSYLYGRNLCLTAPYSTVL
jgi:hypothetical protein